jgi:hypothetical protein
LFDRFLSIVLRRRRDQFPSPIGYIEVQGKTPVGRLGLPSPKAHQQTLWGSPDIFARIEEEIVRLTTEAVDAIREVLAGSTPASIRRLQSNVVTQIPA